MYVSTYVGMHVGVLGGDREGQGERRRKKGRIRYVCKRERNKRNMLFFMERVQGACLSRWVRKKSLDNIDVYINVFLCWWYGRMDGTWNEYTSCLRN